MRSEFRMFPYSILLILFLFCFAFSQGKNIKNFRVSPEITTGWTFCRNQALYASEMLYDHDKEAFWSFFKQLNKEFESAGKSTKSDQEVLMKIVKESTDLPAEFLRLLKINLEMETFAPKFEAISQFQPENICKDSTSFIEYQSGVYACSMEELEGKDLSGVKQSSFDYIKQKLEASPLIRVYTIAGSESFNEIFDFLLEKEVNIAVQLLVKPRKCPFYDEEVYPTGYGLEFELKSAQYVVEEVQEEIPDLEEQEQKGGLEEVLKSFKDIKEVEKIQGKALSSILDNPDFENLLKVSTNIPIISDKLKNFEPTTQQQQQQQQTTESLFRINNFDLKSANVDPFRLLDFMNVYLKISYELLNLTGKSILKKILKSKINNDSTASSIRYKLKSAAISYLNDLEKDKRYSKWSKSFKDSNFEEGKFCSKNILTVVIPINFENKETSSLLENVIQMISFGYPMRFAVLPVVDDDDDHESKIKPWIKAYYAVRESYGLRASISFLRNSVQMYQNNPENSKDLIDFLLLQLNLQIDPKDGETLLKEAENVCKNFKIDQETSELFVNGISTPITRNFPEVLMNQYVKEYELVISNEELKKSKDLYESILKHHEAKEERLSIDEEIRYNNDHLLPTESIKKLLGIKQYYEPESENTKITCWLATEYDKRETFTFLLKILKLNTLNKEIRSRFFVTTPMTSMPNRIVLASTAVLVKEPELIEDVLKFLENFYENYFGGSSDKKDNDLKALKHFEDIDNAVTKKIMKYATNLEDPLIKEIMKDDSEFFSVYNDLDFDESILISLNGNTLQIPIKADEISDKLEELVSIELRERGDRLHELAKDNSNNIAKNVLAYSFVERKLLASIDENLSNLLSISTFEFPNIQNAIEIGDEEGSVFHVEAIFNPFNREGQKFSSIMSYFSNSDLFSFKLGLMANLDSNDPKEGRIYRFVTPETKGTAIPIGPVSDPEMLLAMSLDLPAAWMTISTYANADLDNIRPTKVPHLQASFSLNHIVIEGQATFKDSGDVATGKIVQLYNKKSGLLEDETSVMANFGYYQLKATPGEWNLRVKSSIHEDGNFEYPISEGGNLQLISFGGKFNRIKLSSDGIKIPKTESNAKQAEINVFSLASGLFYERLLRIMITSVMKKTKKSVKFWLLETTMSAKGILALETLSKEFGFEYEFMAYKWPSWLNPQSKKHRTIWAYKILFLDVLFPQNLNRIIFIDADQVVRSDLIELVDLDLNGHVYAMTPFCNDKSEMAPFRFWEHNYWKNHLAGKPYHISALFVVDLLELRKKLVADIIRSQYHILSQDPNSLANLDQDLPNNLQNHIPIYSLPQEWLWCDTWCSQKTKSKAKTIDLCNNPKTFESKIDQAVRIIPEWKSYDEEIKLILEKGKEGYLKNLKKAIELEEHLEL